MGPFLLFYDLDDDEAENDFWFLRTQSNLDGDIYVIRILRDVKPEFEPIMKA